MKRIFGYYISKWTLILLTGDIILFCLSIILSISQNCELIKEIINLRQHLIDYFLLATLYLIIFFAADLYNYQQDFTNWREIVNLTVSTALAAVVVLVISHTIWGSFIGQVNLILHAAIFAFLVILWRWIFSALDLPQLWREPVLIVGAGGSGQRLLELMQQHQRSGFVAVGFVDDDPQKIGKEVAGLPVMADSSKLRELARTYHCSLIVVAITYEKSQKLINILSKICWDRRQVLDMPVFYEFLTAKIPLEHTSDFWLFNSGLPIKSFYCHYLKRLVDLVLSLCGLALLWPLFLIIACVIKLANGSPVLFRQERLGQNCQPFEIIKFRTMIPDAEENGPQWSSADDPRVTKVGRILREWRLDELPQLINVLKGDMSIVGPRPEREVFIRQFQKKLPFWRESHLNLNSSKIVVREFKEQVPYYSYRMLVKPGITGWAQVMYSYASSEEETREKLEYDLYYIKKIGFLLDFVILLKTIRTVLLVPAHKNPG